MTGETPESMVAAVRFMEPALIGVDIAEPLDLRLDLRPRLDGQEVFAERGLLPPYWEGAILVSGEREGRRAAGVGYLEMTGYGERLDLEGIEPGNE